MNGCVSKNMMIRHELPEFSSPMSKHSNYSHDHLKKLHEQKKQSLHLDNQRESMSQYEEDGVYEDATNTSQIQGGEVRSNTFSNSHSYDIYNYSNVYFATEKINLPRERVVDIQSANSSPSHGFRREMSPAQPGHCCKENHSEDGEPYSNQIMFSMRPGSISPRKVGKDYMEQINGSSAPPAFDPNTDYYKEFWRIYLQNENLVSDID
jgi:hypothetical protein